MKLKKHERHYIVKRFQQLETIEDLLHLLNYAKTIIFGNKAHAFELKQLTYYANINVNKKRYVTFSVKKKSGSERTIHSPVGGLKAIQRSLNLILQTIFKPHSAAKGFVLGQSIKDNAKVHIGNHYVYNVDLKDFFYSVDQARVWKCLQLAPFNLGSKMEPNSEHKNLIIVNLISALCCTSIEVERIVRPGVVEKVKRNVVPQGAPTSPVITNVVCQRLDFLLTGLAKRFGLKYSRYADDITFSSSHNVYSPNGDFEVELNRIIVDQNFAINESKTRLQRQGTRQEVTGLVVNENVNVKQSYIKKIRAWLYLWERYGYEKSYRFFLNDYIFDKGHIKEGIPNMSKVIQGRIAFLKMIRGIEDSQYLNLKMRFDLLYERRNGEDHIEKIITYWQEKGFIATARKFSKYPENLDPGSFLKENIDNKYLTRQQNEQLLVLAFQEVDKQKKSLQRQIAQSKLKKADPPQFNKEDPRHVADFMNLFDDPNGLKYLTHDFDESEQTFDIEHFLAQAYKVFDEHTKSKNNSIPQSLWAVVNEFAFARDPFWNKGCKDGWSRPDRIEWSKKEKKHLKRNSEFAQTIDAFRKLTRVEAPELSSIVDRILREKLGDRYSKFNISTQNCEKADFYTLVSFFEEALKLILDGCYKRIDISNQLIISYSRNNVAGYRARILQINHVSSFPMKPLDDFLADIDKGKGEFADIKMKLTGYCNWSIETFWDDHYRRIHLLGERKHLVEILDDPNTISTVNGFRHIFTFFQK